MGSATMSKFLAAMQMGAEVPLPMELGRVEVRPRKRAYGAPA